MTPRRAMTTSPPRAAVVVDVDPLEDVVVPHDAAARSDRAPRSVDDDGPASADDIARLATAAKRSKNISGVVERRPIRARASHSHETRRSSREVFRARVTSERRKKNEATMIQDKTVLDDETQRASTQRNQAENDGRTHGSIFRHTLPSGNRTPSSTRSPTMFAGPPFGLKSIKIVSSPTPIVPLSAHDRTFFFPSHPGSPSSPRTTPSAKISR